MLGLVLSILFNWIYSEFKPFKEIGNSYLAIALSFSLSIFFLASLIIKTNIMSELGLHDNAFGIILALLLCIGPISIVIVQFIELLPLCCNIIKNQVSKCARIKVQPETIEDKIGEETEGSSVCLREEKLKEVHSPMAHIDTLPEEDELNEMASLNSSESDPHLYHDSETTILVAGLISPSTLSVEHMSGAGIREQLLSLVNF